MLILVQQMLTVPLEPVSINNVWLATMMHQEKNVMAKPVYQTLTACQKLVQLASAHLVIIQM